MCVHGWYFVIEPCDCKERKKTFAQVSGFPVFTGSWFLCLACCDQHAKEEKEEN